MKAAIFTLTFLAALIVPYGDSLCNEGQSTELQQDIRRLMDVTGAGNLGVQMMNQMLVPIKQSMPDVPDEFWTRVMAKVDANELTDMVVPIYAEYFTHEEIKQLLAFYDTPLGQKVIATLPAIMQESMAAGQKWGEQLGQQIHDELKAEGYF